MITDKSFKKIWTDMDELKKYVLASKLMGADANDLSSMYSDLSQKDLMDLLDGSDEYNFIDVEKLPNGDLDGFIERYKADMPDGSINASYMSLDGFDKDSDLAKLFEPKKSSIVDDDDDLLDLDLEDSSTDTLDEEDGPTAEDLEDADLYDDDLDEDDDTLDDDWYTGSLGKNVSRNDYDSQDDYDDAISNIVDSLRGRFI